MRSAAILLDIRWVYSQVLGAPPSVASGSRSIVYRCAWRYMMGTPGICIAHHLAFRVSF